MRQTDFVALCEQELKLCKLQPEEDLVVFSEGDRRLDYADAFMTAAERLGARSCHIRLSESGANADAASGVWEVGTTGLASSPFAARALSDADLVIDLTFLVFSRELVGILAQGTRILTCIEPVGLLGRLFPTPKLQAEIASAIELLGQARSLRFTNEAGSDVTYQIGRYPTRGDDGVASTPGESDHWPSGIVYTCGDDAGIEGVVVVAPGDVILPFKRYVQAPIEMTIEAGRIRSIRGGVDAELVSAYIADFDDPDAYGLSHIGWGLNEQAKWAGLATDHDGHGMELRTFAGNVLFSTGPNALLGGPNTTPCHLDIPMRGCSLYLDDRLVIDRGTIVDPSRAEHAL